MKPYLPFFIFIFAFSSIYAQQSGFGTVFPPSPEASALAKYANIPVNHYTGIPDISVPMFTLKGQDFQLPVGLRYHAQGVKVNDIAGSTGMNWSIDGAGVITRVVRDEPDEEGYCSDGNGTNNLVNDPDIQDYVRIAQSYDGEPDLFYFNFFGRSGKFFIDANGDCFTIPHQKIKITPAIGKKGVGYWVIIDEFGNTFTFGQNNVKETTSTNIYYTVDGGVEQWENNSDNEFVSAWYINSAASPTSSDEVNFTYITGSDYSYNITSQKSYTGEISSCNEGGNGTFEYFYDYRTEITIKNPQYLSSINNRLAKVQFNYDTDRTDLPNGKKLNEILIKDYDNNIVDKYTLNYYYYLGQLDGIALGIPCDEPKCHRMFLKAIYRGSQKEIKYREFHYIENLGNIRLPNPNSFIVDHWGFNNFPEDNIGLDYGNLWTKLPENGHKGYKANKSISSAGKIGVLNKVYYETGGYTEFNYSFYPGGNKILDIITKDFNNQIINSRHYTYEDVYTYSEPAYTVRRGSYQSQSFLFIPLPQGCSKVIYENSSESLIALYDINGIATTSAKVTETFLDGSSIEYEYYGFDDYADQDPENTTINPAGPPIVHEPSGQPFTSYTYQGWKRGLMKNKIQKDNVGNEVFKETYEYHFNYALAADINAIKALLVGDVDGDPVLSVGTYRMISQPYFIKKHTSINNNNLTLIKEFKTNTKNYQVHQEIVNNGIEKIITKFKYPVDFLGVAICNEMVTYKNMIANIIEKQIWKTDLNDQNKRIVDGVLMNYWLEQNHIVPLDIHEFQSSTSVNEVDFGEDLNDDNFLSLNTDNEYYTMKKELKYNEFGLITEEKLNDDIPLSYVYGYNNNLPVAKIEGANITTVDNILSSYNGINNLSQQEKSDLKNIPNTLVSFYTYDPLIGMTSETGPDNIKLTYEYDDFGRLKLVKDHNGDILKRYTYQYRVQ